MILGAGEIMWAGIESDPHSVNIRAHRARMRSGVLHKDQLRGLPEPGESPVCGLYFLWWKSILVYIGRSVNIPYRLEQHREMGKIFERATWLPVDPEAAKYYERAYVMRYHPPLNLTKHG